MRDSKVGKWSSFVDCGFNFSWFKSPIAVFEEGSVLEIRFCVRPGHEIKFPLLIAVMNMVGAGLKHATWRNFASSIFCCIFMNNQV